MRGVPSYFLNGNPAVVRAHVHEQAIVNAEGDTRMDVTGSHGTGNVHHPQRIEGQVAPATVVQVPESVGDRYRSLSWAGLAAGAGRAPLLASDRNAATGEATVSWSAACGASDHALLSGPLAQVGSHAWDEVTQGLGVDGPASVAVGVGDRFFVIVGRTTANDGSAGRSSSGVERPGADLALEGALPRAIGGPCP